MTTFTRFEVESSADIKAALDLIEVHVLTEQPRFEGAIWLDTSEPSPLVVKGELVAQKWIAIVALLNEDQRGVDWFTPASSQEILGKGAHYQRVLVTPPGEDETHRMLPRTRRWFHDPTNPLSDSSDNFDYLSYVIARFLSEPLSLDLPSVVHTISHSLIPWYEYQIDRPKASGGPVSIEFEGYPISGTSDPGELFTAIPKKLISYSLPEGYDPFRMEFMKPLPPIVVKTDLDPDKMEAAAKRMADYLKAKRKR